jgi:Family of unknown function (DUF6188)
MSGPQLLRETLIDLPCTSIIKTDYLWQFAFGSAGVSLNLECPWRFLLQGMVAFGCDDHQQQFGRPSQIDGVEKSHALLLTSPVVSVEVRDGTGDLAIGFQNGVRLEAFNLSSGYEGWTCSLADGRVVVAQGGGNVCVSNPVRGN